MDPIGDDQDRPADLTIIACACFPSHGVRCSVAPTRGVGSSSRTWPPGGSSEAPVSTGGVYQGKRHCKRATKEYNIRVISRLILANIIIWIL